MTYSPKPKFKRFSWTPFGCPFVQNFSWKCINFDLFTKNLIEKVFSDPWWWHICSNFNFWLNLIIILHKLINEVGTAIKKLSYCNLKMHLERPPLFFSVYIDKVYTSITDFFIFGIFHRISTSFCDFPVSSYMVLQLWAQIWIPHQILHWL